METNKVKEQLNSLIKVMNEALNVKKNPLSEYAIPILRDALSLIEEQRKKIHNQKKALAGNTKCIQGHHLENKAIKRMANDELQAAKKKFEREFDEAKLLYFNQITTLEGKIQDLEKENARLKSKNTVKVKIKHK